MLLALYSYAAALKRFVLSDFAWNFRCGLAEAERVAEEAVEGGYLARSEEVLVLTEAGCLALLDGLCRRGGRWWLVSDEGLVWFMVREGPLWVAPFTFKLWDRVSAKARFAAVVRGRVGVAWLERYARGRPFESLLAIERGVRRLIARVRAGSGRGAVLEEVSMYFRRLAELRRSCGLGEVPIAAPGASWGDIGVALEELVRGVELTRRELLAALEDRRLSR